MQKKLIEGYRRFREGYYQRNRERLEQLAYKQTPEVAMLSCCDSRVDPGILFDVEPGDVFVIRNVANLVPPYETSGDYHGTSAALQFAVTCLKVKQIIVLGHANCGGIRALMKNDMKPGDDGFINKWMKIAEPAKQEVLARDDLHDMEEKISACELAAISHSLRNLMTHPWVRERVQAGKLDLIGCYYDLHTSKLVDVDEINALTPGVAQTTSMRGSESG
ncbi:MAG TPA: carbonic anhydrase [Gammaproteobacteria bacterium]|nr:carbonic anhydrase [Gammaproteobacteria bacterium]